MFFDAEVQRGVNVKLIEINICNTLEVAAHERYKLYDDNKAVQVNSKTIININWLTLFWNIIELRYF